jgi:uncharacterized protein (DUF433 family)
MAKLDPRLAPVYTIREAARHVRVPASTVRSWINCREYSARSDTQLTEPMGRASHDPSHRLSFRILIELAALRVLRTQCEFNLSAVRSALDYACGDLKAPELLASRDLYTRPGAIFLGRYGEIIGLKRAGQLGIQAVLQGLQQRIRWEGAQAVAFFPPPPNRPEAKSVMIDPRISFGRPIIARLGVTTSAVVGRVNAGEDPAQIARDYGATRDEIMDAVAYERAA